MHGIVASNPEGKLSRSRLAFVGLLAPYWRLEDLAMYYNNIIGMIKLVYQRALEPLI